MTEQQAIKEIERELLHTKKNCLRYARIDVEAVQVLMDIVKEKRDAPPPHP